MTAMNLVVEVEAVDPLKKGVAGFNFTNILPEPFLYERVLHSFSLLAVGLCNFLAKDSAKAACKIVGEIDYRSTCLNGGTCKDGSCVCRPGYAGDFCQV